MPRYGRNAFLTGEKASTARKTKLENANNRRSGTSISIQLRAMSAHGQTHDQPGPRKKVPINVSTTAMITNQVMSHYGNVTLHNHRRHP